MATPALPPRGDRLVDNPNVCSRPQACKHYGVSTRPRNPSPLYPSSRAAAKTRLMSAPGLVPKYRATFQRASVRRLMAHRHQSPHSRDGRLLSAFCRAHMLDISSLTMTLAAVRIYVGPQHGVHARQMPVALLLKPLQNVAIDAKMNSRLARRHAQRVRASRISKLPLGLRAHRRGSCLCPARSAA
jgi:hypothetical protein